MSGIETKFLIHSKMNIHTFDLFTSDFGQKNLQLIKNSFMFIGIYTKCELWLTAHLSGINWRFTIGYVFINSDLS